LGNKRPLYHTEILCRKKRKQMLRRKEIGENGDASVVGCSPGL
jgi:hypothetical protein